MPEVVGIVLAAGAGRRMGRPKALVGDAAGSWLVRAVDALVAAGCAPVLVVLGAAAEQARALLADARPGAAGVDVHVVVAGDWAEGMGASLRAGLHAAEEFTATAALITLVDLPDVGAEVMARLLDRPVGAGSDGAAERVLARAAYRGVPGHPVLIGRAHWPAASNAAIGDRGARALFTRTEHELVECGDLAGGVDVDTR
jgi:CTP:molybdopterin cytidylyltransferase MocA